LKDSEGGCAAAAVSPRFCVARVVGVAEDSNVAGGARVSEGMGVISLVSVCEGTGVGTSMFVAVTVGLAFCTAVREDREDVDILYADCLMPCGLRLSAAAWANAAVGISALNKIAAINKTRMIISVLGLTANIVPPDFVCNQERALIVLRCKC